MKPQLTLNNGSTTVEFYGGYKEIGGNCILIKDRDRRIIFDNGIRFQVLKKYYRGRLQPLGINEMRRIGAIPPLSIFKDVEAVYISHFHLDHLGLLGALPPGTQVYVPSTGILQTLEEWYRASPTWLAEIPHALNVDIRELRPYQEDPHGVIPIPVSHSAYPSYSLQFHGYDRTVFYSGDLRVRGPLGPRIDTLQNLERAIGSDGADIALMEGTNLGVILTPMGPEEFRSVLSRVLMGDNLVFISIDPLDFEMLTVLSELSSSAGRTVVIASSRIVDLLPQWLTDEFSGSIMNLTVAMEQERPSPVPINYVSIKDDVLSDPGNFLVIQEPLGLLEMLRKMQVWGEDFPRGATVVLTTPEPLEAEVEVEEEALVNWLGLLGVQVFRVRVSGHYYPHELRDILSIVKPRMLIPIHTKHPSLMFRLAGL